MLYSGLPLWDRRSGRFFHVMHPGWTLAAGQSRLSLNKAYQLVMQGDGNLVLYQVGVRALWATGTQGSNCRAVMQGDGNLVVYNSSNVALWNSRTAGRSGSRLVTQDDGNLVMYQGSTAVWATHHLA